MQDGDQHFSLHHSVWILHRLHSLHRAKCPTGTSYRQGAVIVSTPSFQIVDTHYPDLGWSVQAYGALLLLILIPYSLLRQLKYLAPFSLIANILTFFGLIVILQYCFRNLHDVSSLPAFNNFKGLALYFGTAIYAFEGIGVVRVIILS
jgi:proton-coupled amino acid transporter